MRSHSVSSAVLIVLVIEKYLYGLRNPKSVVNPCVCVRKRVTHLISVCLRVCVDGNPWSIKINFRFSRLCSGLLKCCAMLLSSDFCFIVDLWLFNLNFKGVCVSPTYPLFLHFVQ